MAARKYKIFDEINAREAAKPGGATAGGGGSRPAAAGVQPIAGLDETLKAKAAGAQRLLSQATLPASPLLWNDPARARLGARHRALSAVGVASGHYSAGARGRHAVLCK